MWFGVTISPLITPIQSEPERVGVGAPVVPTLLLSPHALLVVLNCFLCLHSINRAGATGKPSAGIQSWNRTVH